MHQITQSNWQVLDWMEQWMCDFILMSHTAFVFGPWRVWNRLVISSILLVKISIYQGGEISNLSYVMAVIFVWPVLKNCSTVERVRVHLRARACVCVCAGCVCMCVLDREGSREVASRALVVVQMAVYLTSYCDWLVSVNYFQAEVMTSLWISHWFEKYLVWSLFLTECESLQNPAVGICYPGTTCASTCASLFLGSALAKCRLLHCICILDQTWIRKLKIIITLNTSIVCFSSRPQLCVPDSGWLVRWNASPT